MKMGCWGKASWGWNWGGNGFGGGRSYNKKIAKKAWWSRDDDDGHGAKKAFKFCGNDDWRDGWKKADKKAWFRKNRDDDDEDRGGFKGWSRKRCDRDQRDDDDRGDKDCKKIEWSKVTCGPDLTPEPEQPNRAPEFTNTEPAVATVTGKTPGTHVIDLAATDPDGDTLIYSILDANDGDTADGDSFTVDPDTGVLTLRTAITPLGSTDGDAVFEIGVMVSDGELTDTIMLDIAYLTGT